jgi:flagellar assembly factor FliW
MINTETIPAEKKLTYQTRFGEVNLRDDRLLSFPRGLLGFEDCTVFGLSQLPNTDESPLLLLQCINEPQFAFVVADPAVMGLTIEAEDREKAMTDTNMSKETTQFLSILTLYDQGDSYYVTANLKAPIMIDTTTRVARQHVLTSGNYTTQHKL